ncbi:hypothetical protein [Pedobacter lusitanus]|uniref:hypothetical protein n=1 Tax=Pedobacter lusitanus TaxID=1503925 RepID=UPI0032AFD868
MNTSFSEIFKLPHLVCHFQQHHRLNSQIGIIEFLSMHYFGEDLNDNDDEDDMKLPFKKISNQGHISQAVSFSKPILLKQQYFSVLAAPCKPEYSWLSNPALDNLFRPPRA